MLMVLFGVFSGLFFSFFSGGFCWLYTICALLFSCFFSVFLLYSHGWGSCDCFFSVDLMSSCLVLLSIWLSVLMFLASNKILLKASRQPFPLAVSGLCLVLVVCFFCHSFMAFYIFFEASLVPTLLLILGWGYQPERLQAGMYMMLYTITASLPLLGVIVHQFVSGGHSSMLLQWQSMDVLGQFYGFLFWCCLIFAFLVKIPVFLVHLWLPKAHVEAPVAGSMILAGVLLKLGGYGLLRSVLLMPGINSLFSDLFMGLALWGGVVTGFICLRQVDLKALIAYSSVGHMGLFAGGVFSGTVWGWQGGLLMMLAHGLCSSALFSLANLSYEAVGSRGMILCKGLMCFFPALTIWWFMFCAGNMAAPPSLNLVGEIMLLTSLLSHSWIWFSLIGLLGFLGGAYSLFLFTQTQHGKSTSSHNVLVSSGSVSHTMLLLHWVPLNFFVLSLDKVCDWVF